MSQSGTTTAAAPASQTTILGLTPAQIVSLVGTLAGAFVPGGSALGMTIPQLTGLAVGVANGVTDAISAFEEVAAVNRTGATELPPELWAKVNAAADAANQAAADAEDAVIEGKKGDESTT